MVTIFEALRDDHERQRDLVGRLLDTEGDSDERRKIFDELKIELEAHAGAEERFFYIPLMEHDLTQDKARHSVAEHKELDDFVEQLDEYDMTAPQWIVTARELAHRLTHHLDEEEHEVFQIAGKALNETQKGELGASYQGDMHRRRADL
jgi:hypothetical protein